MKFISIFGGRIAADRVPTRTARAIVTSKPNHFFGYRHVKLFDRPRIARRDDTPPFSRIIGSTIVFDGSADWRGGEGCDSAAWPDPLLGKSIRAQARSQRGHG